MRCGPLCRRGTVSPCGHCHCSSCRAASGPAFSAFAGIEKDKLQVTDGEDCITLFEGPDNSRCQLCGSPLFILVRDGRFFHVRRGTLVDDPGVRPMFPIFVGSKALWHKITDPLPQYAELPPSQA